MDGIGGAASTTGGAAGAIGDGCFRTRRVIGSAPTPCARRIGSGRRLPPPPPPAPDSCSSGARNTMCRTSGRCWSVLCTARRTVMAAGVVPINMTMMTTAACSPSDAASCAAAPNRRDGSRGVSGSSGSRWSTTSVLARRIPRDVLLRMLHAREWSDRSAQLRRLGENVPTQRRAWLRTFPQHPEESAGFRLHLAP
jgi:hypothetical protein